MKYEVKRFMVYWHKNAIYHYYATYDEAKAYIVNNNIKDARIAYLLAYQEKPLLVELGGCKDEKA